MTDRRSRWFLVVLLLLQLVLLSAQAPAGSSGGTPLESAFLVVVAWVPRMVDGTLSYLDERARGLARRSVVLEENERLRLRNRELLEKVLELRGLEQDLERLRGAVEYQRAFEVPMRAADVVYADHTSWLRTLVVLVGTSGARPNQPVISEEGVVGRVWRVGGPYAKVQLVTDRASSVGAMLGSTRRQGIARGTEEGLLALDFVPRQAPVAPGERVLTSGIDGVYPRGIPVGTVLSVETAEDSLFHRITVAPAVDFGRLDQVWLVERPEPPPEIESAADEAGP